MKKRIKQKKEWYCYLCGKILKDNYYLWSMSISTDRVFLCCHNCINQINIEGDYFITNVKDIL